MTKAGGPVTSGRGEVLWSPPADVRETTRIGDFMTWVGTNRELHFDTYDDLWSWSIADLEGFWSAVTSWAGVRWRTPPERVLARGDRTMPGARWWPGGRVNYAEHAVGRATFEPDGVAVIARSQTRQTTRLTWGELDDAVARCRAGLRGLGVGHGDRVAAYAPNIPETLVAFLATASLGAIWSSCAPEFGTRAVIDRLAQVEPTVLIAVDGYRYGERAIPRHRELEAITAALPTLKAVVTIPYLTDRHDGWGRLLEHAPDRGFEAVPADHPLYILYSSGTTGAPKAIVHGHAGILAEHLKVLALHHDLGPGQRLMWFTTTGWMMWNYLVSGLLVGATVVLFDGDPGFPDLSTLWRVAEEESIDVLGVSAPFLMACRKAGVQDQIRISARLRQVGSTGAPLPADGFRWVHGLTGRAVQVSSVSGGTDVCSAFVGTVPLLAVRAGEITCRMLGCDVQAVTPAGAPCPAGVEGELVVASPMPSMPLGFWHDPDGSRYRSAYFDDFPGKWRHGDWITFFEDGASVISGRSDATLNRGGVRLGTSDFYAIVEAMPEVADSLVIHLDDEEEPSGRLVLFVALVAGADLDDALRARICAALRTELSPRHVPDRIEAVPAVPRTLSGKKLEVPVKRLLSGTAADEAAADGSLMNPGSLRYFEGLRGRDVS